MRSSSLLAMVTLLFFTSHALAVSPTSGASGGGAGASALEKENNNGGSRTGASKAGRLQADLLCAGLLGSGFLGNVLTVAPMTSASGSDPNTAIQFSKIWSDSHQATVGGKPSVAVPRPKPVIAVVKLPITFSAADRQKFEDAGWKLHDQAAGHAASFCMENASRQGSGDSSAAQGMICVTATGT